MVKKTEKKDYSFQIAASEMDIPTSVSSSSSYSRPSEYSTMCKYSWSDYTADTGYGYLIDRMIHFGVNGTRWHLKNKELKQKEKEREFWNFWAKRINKGMIDVLPGLDEVEKWLFKNLLLTGMSAVEWDWENVSFEKTSYQIPVNITIHPSSSIELVNTSGEFGKTKALVKNTNGDKRELERKSKTGGSFILKLNYSPADLTVSGTSVVNTVSALNNAESTLYPKPPFLNAHEDISTRLKLRESDMDTVFKLLDQITNVSIGDENHPPKPPVIDENGDVVSKGTIEEVKESMNDESGIHSGATRTLYLPYYVKLVRDNPDTAALLNFDKYLASTINLFLSFGIIIVPGGDTRLNLTDINTQNFEQYIESVRKFHIGRFIESILCAEIVERNKGKLTEVPSLRFNQVNTKTAEFRTQILNMLKLGRTSTRMAQEGFNINKDHVLSDMQEEHEENTINGMSEIDIFNKSVPISYKQQSVNADGETTISDRDGTNEGGHPDGQENKDEDED
jgi:hypothetical protein